ncbi:UNVERIFIED_CONTAM: hypothetical protein Scaly_0257800 [Sesamum calycinum]|uniref:Reverse transcriptase RNase H-like domain-containing protein n=1 Tax=Sesamum calycinum TaxID=2727403 RepID=A0AAW2S9L3_9LAMI
MMKEKENALYYLSRTMTPNELKYSPIEKLCLALIFSIQMLKHYFQSHSIHLVSKANPLKYVMAKPVFSDRLARWYLQLQQFEITYVPQKAVKGQVLADFLADHPMPAEWELSDDLPDEDVLVIEVTPPWKMYFDGASHKRRSRRWSCICYIRRRSTTLLLYINTELLNQCGGISSSNLGIRNSS